MNKKGATQQILLYVFYLVMVFIITYSLINYLDDRFGGSEFNKEFIAEEVGLAIDTLSFSPSSINMKFNVSKEFILENKNSVLNVKLKDLEVSKKYNLISKIDDFSVKTDEIKIKKEGKIKVS